LLFQQNVLSHEGLGSSGPEEFAQFAQQVKENEEDVRHRRSLRLVVRLGKPADTPFNCSFYEFAIHTREEVFRTSLLVVS